MKFFAYTTFVTDRGWTYGGGVVSADPSILGVLVHETFHSFWFHHYPGGNSAMAEGFAIAAAQVVLYGKTNLAEAVFGTKLYCRDMWNAPYFPLGTDTVNLADGTLSQILDFLQEHDEYGLFDWRDPSLHRFKQIMTYISL